MRVRRANAVDGHERNPSAASCCRVPRARSPKGICHSDLIGPRSDVSQLCVSACCRSYTSSESAKPAYSASPKTVWYLHYTARIQRKHIVPCWCPAVSIQLGRPGSSWATMIFREPLCLLTVTRLENGELYRTLSRARLRILLEALEDASKSKYAENLFVLDKLTIEHLMPQSWGGELASSRRVAPARGRTGTRRANPLTGQSDACHEEAQPQALKRPVGGEAGRHPQTQRARAQPRSARRVG